MRQRQMITTGLRKIRLLGASGKRSQIGPEPSPPDSFSSATERIRATGQFTPDDIDLIVQTISQHDILHGSPWDDFRLANLVLPSWFDLGLHPDSEDYAVQQQRLWSLVSRRERPYAPELDEKEAPLTCVDPVKQPAYYMRRDSETMPIAGDQIIGLGMILKHCGLRPGDHALEYGAGFGQPALALSRLGVQVDTVDISSMFCDLVRQQAQFYQVPLTPFEGRFGWNPRGDHKYDLILFYEAFHHCTDFRTVVPELKRHLAPAGRVLLVGEPIARSQNRYLPYPWGLRLDAEPIAQVRRFGWFELGFTEDFLVGLFTNAGFAAERIDCQPSVFGAGYIFRHRAPKIELKDQWLTDDMESGWNTREDIGRWTKAEGRLYLDTTDSFRALELDVSNRHPVSQSVEFHYGDQRTIVRFKMGERKTIMIDATKKAAQIVIRAKTHVPADNLFLRSRDTRELGILVRSVTYTS